MPVILALLLGCLWLVPSRAHCAPVVLDFEELPEGPLTTQYASQGITFDAGERVIDFSSQPGFAHSGSKALIICYGVEFCTDVHEFSFAAPQRRVRVWAGWNYSLTDPFTVVLEGLNEVGAVVASAMATFPASSTPAPVRDELLITRPTPEITSARVRILETIYAPSVVIDDVEFGDPICGNGLVEPPEQCDPAAPSSCPAASPSCVDCLCTIRVGACGDGHLDLGETCDDGNTAEGDCCSADCQHIAAAGTVCRPSKGFCDLPDVCDGSRGLCPSDAFKENDTPCVIQDLCIEKTLCKDSTCSGLQVCSTSADQKLVKGKPTPAIVVECTASTEGASRPGACAAQAMVGAQGVLGSVAPETPANGRPVTKRVRKKLQDGHTTLVLRLNAHGRRLLARSPTGQLVINVETTIKLPRGDTVNRLLSLLLTRRS
jgi:cysteine-rich repeat protein